MRGANEAPLARPAAGPSSANFLDWHRYVFGGDRYLRFVRRPFVATGTFPAMKPWMSESSMDRRKFISVVGGLVAFLPVAIDHTCFGSWCHCNSNRNTHRLFAL